MDRYTQLVNTSVGSAIAKQVGLPKPVPLQPLRRRGEPVIEGKVLVGGAPGGRLAVPLARVLADVGASASTPLRPDLRAAAAEAGLDAAPWTPKASVDHRYGALVFDATGIVESAQLEELHAFFHPTIRRVATCGRVVVLGTPPESARKPAEAVAQRALEGLTRAMGKEIGRGATVQLVYVEPGAEDQIAGTLRFFLSPRSAFVSGQVVRIGAGGGARAERLRLGAAARRQGRAWSPAPRAASAPRSPRRSRATARTSSASTCPRWRTTSRRSPPASAAPRSRSTSPTRTRRERSPRT